MSDLVLAELHKIYQTRNRPPVEAVRDLNLDIESGELVALLGPSGCGKSTTLRMIAGLEAVTSGDILLDRRSIVRLRPQERNIGVAFENYALYPPLTVGDNIAFGLRARGVENRRHRVLDIAERLGLRDILGQRPSSLSSGQKQRVALARAIVREPDVLLLDEPLSHLDAGQRDVTRRELKRLQRDLGYTTILVTHDQEEALSIADRVVVMRDGAARQVGTPDQVYDDPADLFVADFVGEPAMNLLPARALDNATVSIDGVVDVGVALRDRPAGEVVVGIRPEDVQVRARGADPTHGVEPASNQSAPALAKVAVYEDFLEYALVTLELEGVGKRIVARVNSGQPVDTADQLSVTLDPRRLCVFDSRTGERLR